MKRIIINLDPEEKDVESAIQRTVSCIKHYVGELKRDGERITATWDSAQSICVFHDRQKQLCIYSPHVQEDKNDWFNR